MASSFAEPRGCPILGALDVENSEEVALKTTVQEFFLLKRSTTFTGPGRANTGRKVLWNRRFHFWTKTKAQPELGFSQIIQNSV
jgi:hypothetical protein